MESNTEVPSTVPPKVTGDAEPDPKVNPIRAWTCIPHFASQNIQRTIDYYTKTLHFSLGGTQSRNGELSFCSVAMGKPAFKANIYFFLFKADEGEQNSQGRNGMIGSGVFHPSTAMIGLGTTQVDEYYERLKREGKAEIVDEIADRDYGYRLFAVRDGDGNVLQFFCFIEGGNPSD